MKKVFIKISLALATAVLVLPACNKALPVEDYDNTVNYKASVTSGKGVIMTKAALPGMSSDANLHLNYICSSGIKGTEFNGYTATKGKLVNDNENEDMSNIELQSSSEVTITSFKVAAWTGSKEAIPAYADVTYSNGKWDTATEYTWRGGEEKTFVAYTNLPASGAVIASESAGTQKLTYTVPETASSQTDILMGYYKGTGNSSGTADITFYHPLTAVKFVVGDLCEHVSAIKSVSLQGVYSEGSTTQSTAGAGFTWDADGTGTVSQTFSGSLPAKGKQLGESFLLIPQAMTEKAQVLISLVMTVGGNDVTLYTPLKTGEWKAGYTNVYTIKYSDELIIDGAYTVSAGPDGIPDNEDDIKVNFCCGNLYWNGTEFRTEDWSQVDYYPNTEVENKDIDPKHISYFYWSKDAAEARSLKELSLDSATEKDILFTNAQEEGGETKPNPDFTVDGIKGVFRTLSFDEWSYLFAYGEEEGKVNTAETVRKDKFKGKVSVNGMGYSVVLLPDEWDESIISLEDFAERTAYNESTTPSWSEMEAAGAVCLWNSGRSTYWSNKDKRVINCDNRPTHYDYTSYCSSTPCNDGYVGDYKYTMASFGWYMYEGNIYWERDDVYECCKYRYWAYPIRLVRDVK